MKTQEKAELYKSRYLIVCLLISILGFYSTHYHILELFFLIFIMYSGYTVAHRLDNANNKKQ